MRIELTPSAWKAEVLPLNYIRINKLERKTRFELATLALARRCSTPEPLPHTKYLIKLVEGGGFEPPKAQLTDLQSAPFGHSGIPRYCLLCYYTIILINVQSFLNIDRTFSDSVLPASSVELAEGIMHMLRICRPAPPLSAGLDISLLESLPGFLPALEPFRVRFPVPSVELAEGIEPPTC